MTDDSHEYHAARRQGWSLPALALRRPVTVLMGVLTFIIIGLASWWQLPLDFMIDLVPHSCGVYIPYPGATPEQVEEEIAIPAEGLFKSIPGLQNIRTHSDGGGCNIWMRFSYSESAALVSAEVRDRIERLKLLIPQEIDHIFLRRFEPNALPIIQFALLRNERQDELAQYARTTLRNRLLRLDGIADVQVSGREEELVYVNFDQNALISHRLSITDVIASLQAHSVNVGLGELTDGRDTYYVRALDEFATSRDLENVVVSPAGIRLRDVAEVEVHGPSGADSFTIDGKQGVFISVVKDAEANTVKASHLVRDELERIKEIPEFEGTDFFVFEDHAEIIELAVNGLYTVGTYGSLMAFVVLWLFLRKTRITLVVALAIPISLLVSPIYIYFTGRTLNLITIGAMIISLGMLVDNAIVVVENIHRHELMGRSPLEAARRGASEVGLAICAATLTTLVVFLPMFYMPAGELSSIMEEFAGPISCSLTMSLVMALTVLPVAQRYSARQATRKRKTGARRWRLPRFLAIPRLGGWMERAYEVVLGLGLRWRFGIMLLTLGLMGATMTVAYPRTGFRGMPEIDLRTLSIRFNAESNYGQENAVATVDDLVARINTHKEELGIRNIYVHSGGWGGYINVYLYDDDEKPSIARHLPETEEVRERIAAILPERVPGGTLDCGLPTTNPEGSSSVRVQFRGQDSETLRQLADEFMVQMRRLPELRNVESTMPKESEEIQIEVDEVRAAGAGMSPLSIARSVDFALRGTPLPYLKREGREISVRGQLALTDRGTTNDLERMALPGAGGNMLSLAQLVDMRKGETPPSISRSDARSYTEIQGKLEADDLLEVRGALQQLIANFDTPTGYSVELDENMRHIDETLAEFNKTMLMAIALIYLLLAALFESWLLPLSVVAAVPLAYTGVYWTLYLTGTSMDTLSLVGSVFLCGVIVNNGIVIVDHINALRREGLTRYDAVLQGGRNRLRPVMMTSLTTILGVMPLAFGGAAGGALDALGRTLVGGLTVGSALTILVVPLIYTLFDDLQTWTGAYVSSLARLAGGRRT